MIFKVTVSHVNDDISALEIKIIFTTDPYILQETR